MSDEVEKEEKAMAAVDSILNRMVENIVETVLVQVKEAVRDAAFEAMKHASSDAVANYRQHVFEQVRGNGWQKEDHWGRRIRNSIYLEHKEEIIKMISEDLKREYAAKVLAGCGS